jgi:hypothetical protein
VNLEGKDFTRLTEAPGYHEVQFAPSKRFFSTRIRAWSARRQWN